MPTSNPNQMRTQTYPQSIVQGKAVPISGNVQVAAEFPIGPGYYKTVLRFYFNVTNVTGASSLIAEGLFNFIRQIYYRGDTKDIFVDHCSGREMFKVAIFKSKSVPRNDALALSVATYIIEIPIFHADPQSVRPEDTILASGRYKQITLDISTGPLSDLVGTVGSLAMNVTMDVDIVRTYDDWDQAAAPVLWVQSYSNAPLEDANSGTEIDLERDSTSWLKRLYVHASTGGTAGLAWYGINSDAVIDRLTVSSGDKSFCYQQKWEGLQEQNKDDYSLEAIPSGVAVVDFMRDKSNLSALYTYLQQLKLTWTNQAGIAANDIVTACQEHRRNVNP